MARKPTTFSMRMPEDLNEKIQTYAAEHNCTKAEAMSHFARAGIALEEGEIPTPTSGMQEPRPEESSTTAQALSNIQERLEALQSLPTIEPTPGSAIVPIDIRDKIQAYSTQHDCSEQDALTYYARIGIQMTDKDHPATSAEVAELSRRLDILAKDNAAKTEQMKQMAEMLVSIRDYTKPDELELEGELADQEAEDVDTEITEEERQRIADEHTRQIVSDVVGGYIARQREEQAVRDAQQAQQSNSSNPMPLILSALVAIIVSLIMGLVVILSR